MRHYEAAELVRVAAPIYLKYGLRNSPGLYPSGQHLESTVLALSRERVRRAAISLAIVHRRMPDAKPSPIRTRAMSMPSINPRTGETGPWTAPSATPADVAAAAKAAAAAFTEWLRVPSDRRSRLLREMADRLEADKTEIVQVADFESGLGAARLNGELDRTTGQLRAFAAVVDDGSYVEAIISPADNSATPPRPDIRRMLIALGPVAVFTPSNFPLAFGVAGGDTAAALAAGCPVIVKGHPSHPQTSARCATAIHGAVAAVHAPAAAFALVQSGEPEISRVLVQAPEIAAVGFTGSQAVGRSLADLASARPQPIPFYGELGSLNPVFLAPHALAARGDAIADAFVASMTLGTGQFCTKPGVIVVPAGTDGDRFLSTVERLLATRDAGVMLNAGLQSSLAKKIDRTRRVAGVREYASDVAVPEAGAFAAPRLFVVDDPTWRARPELHEEHFGPVAIAIRTSADQVGALAAAFDGQLTATLHADAEDSAWASTLIDVLATKAGRLVWNSFPTGVAVVPAMQHGGPVPVEHVGATHVGGTDVDPPLPAARRVSECARRAVAAGAAARESAAPPAPDQRRVDAQSRMRMSIR